jgi:hypothetical protein
MKKLIAVSFVAALACKNPEDKSEMNKDSISNSKEHTLNSNPGPFSADTSAASRGDTSNFPIDSTKRSK